MNVRVKAKNRGDLTENNELECGESLNIFLFNGRIVTS